MDYPKIAQQVLDRVGGPAKHPLRSPLRHPAASCDRETTPRRTKRRWKM